MRPAVRPRSQRARLSRAGCLRAACALRHGTWLGGTKYEGPCTLVSRLEAVCVRVRLAVDFTWALDTVSDGAPDRGCWWRRGQMTNAIYTPLVKADTAVNMGGVPFSIRGADDPYVVAQRVSEGTMCASLLSPICTAHRSWLRGVLVDRYFGKNYSDQKALGVSFWVHGIVALLPCCVFFAVMKRSSEQKREQVREPAEP